MGIETLIHFPIPIPRQHGLATEQPAQCPVADRVCAEVFSLPLYLLCALARRKRLLSQEAALKYFLLGAYASAFFLFGVALIYGFTAGIPGRAAGVDFATINAAVTESPAINPQRPSKSINGKCHR